MWRPSARSSPNGSEDSCRSGIGQPPADGFPGTRRLRKIVQGNDQLAVERADIADAEAQTLVGKFVDALGIAHIRSSASMPSSVRPVARTRFVAAQIASRDSRTTPSALSTGHCS